MVYHFVLPSQQTRAMPDADGSMSCRLFGFVSVATFLSIERWQTLFVTFAWSMCHGGGSGDGHVYMLSMQEVACRSCDHF